MKPTPIWKKTPTDNPNQKYACKLHSHDLEHEVEISADRCPYCCAERIKAFELKNNLNNNHEKQ